LAESIRDLSDTGAQSKAQGAHGETEANCTSLAARTERENQQQRRERSSDAEIKAPFDRARIVARCVGKQ
jgi:hypothetical protein